MKILWFAIASCLAVLNPDGAHAQSDYPNNTVRIVDTASGSMYDRDVHEVFVDLEH